MVQREDLATGLLDPLDHLELHLQRPHEPVEVGDDDVVGLTGLDHLDGLEQAGALDERALARDVDLGEVRDEPLAALARPALSSARRESGSVLRAVALGADTDDGYGAGLLVTVRSYRSAGTLRRLQALDPTGEKARAVKARYVGVCRGCGRYTPARNGKGDAYAYCKVCHPGAIECRWTAERVLAAMGDWHGRYGRLPSSYDWSRTHARRPGGEAVARLAAGEWPAASLVTRLFGTWSAARAVAAQRAGEMTKEVASASSSFARESISLPKPRESTAKTEDLRGGELTPEPSDLQVLFTARPDFAHNSGR